MVKHLILKLSIVDIDYLKTAVPYLIWIISGVLMLSYRSMAVPKGWKIGQLYVSDKPILIGGGLVVISIINLLFITKWYYVLVIILCSWIISGIVTYLFKSFVQYLTILLIVFAAALMALL